MYTYIDDMSRCMKHDSLTPHRWRSTVTAPFFWNQRKHNTTRWLCVYKSITTAVLPTWSTPLSRHWVPRARTATGQRSFAVNGPATWNRLPLALRSPDLSESAFKRALKTHLFSTARRHWNVFMILAPDINIQTDLRTYFPVHVLRKIKISQLARQQYTRCR